MGDLAVVWSARDRRRGGRSDTARSKREACSRKSFTSATRLSLDRGSLPIPGAARSRRPADAERACTDADDGGPLEFYEGVLIASRSSALRVGRACPLVAALLGRTSRASRARLGYGRRARCGSAAAVSACGSSRRGSRRSRREAVRRARRAAPRSHRLRCVGCAMPARSSALAGRPRSSAGVRPSAFCRTRGTSADGPA